MVFYGFVGMFFGMVAFVVHAIVNGFDRIRASLLAIANDDEDQSVAGITRSDEIGEMARAVLSLRNRARERLQRLTEMAYFDPLTKLSNRARFRDELDRLLQEDEAISTAIGA